MRNLSLLLTCVSLISPSLTLAQSASSGAAKHAEVVNQNTTPTVADSAKLISTPALPPTLQQEFQRSIKDVHFDFDRAELRAEDRAILASDAEWLKSHGDVIITLEGNADERGDLIYNLVLSGVRAITTRDALVELGVPSDRIAFATGWGKLYPVCSESDESCWSQNRRTHITTWPPEEQVPTRVASLRH
jgi:peptidoglycan-associated lipoprotein